MRHECRVLSMHTIGPSTRKLMSAAGNGWDHHHRGHTIHCWERCGRGACAAALPGILTHCLRAGFSGRREPAVSAVRLQDAPAIVRQAETLLGRAIGPPASPAEREEGAESGWMAKRVSTHHGCSVWWSILLLLIAIAVKLDSRAPSSTPATVWARRQALRYDQVRSMRPDADRIGPPAAGVTMRASPGRPILRMTKLDEAPQLINVQREMSLVGRRVAYFFDFYTEEEKAAIWSVRPGMTDYASIHSTRDKLLAGAEDPVRPISTCAEIRRWPFR